MELVSHVTTIGDEMLPSDRLVTVDEARALPEDAPLRCVDAVVQQRMIKAVDAAGAAGDTLGGAFEVIVTGVPIGLGSYVQWDRKLDGRLAQAVMSIHAIKAVGLGIGPEVAVRPGSRVHDEILNALPGTDGPVSRPTNRAGGLEGGVTNGQDLREEPAAIERSDVCAVPAAAVVAEAMVALVLADAFLEKFGADSIDEIERHFAVSQEQVRERFSGPRQPA
jgi:chorismate synthase